ncbi:tetratricopeptide repeat protein [Halalkalibacterium ligniniphilum]|uniref:tetratricopeptide repeat protein n=1 Tax=Halalkalibacterium ligniniphilum TaxID=1134413 RepID=UPI000348CCBF|nr:tetratricopeptide repeat protein [Halalkalibacterium ligniniphilum]
MKQIEQALEKIENGEIEQGLVALSEAEKTSDHEMKFTIAETYYELGHLDKAKGIVEELLFLYPDEGSLYVFLAEILVDLNEEDEAIELLNEIKEDDPSYLQSRLLLADLYQLQALDEVAEQKLLEAAKIAPDEPIISYGLGEFYLDRGDYMKSIPHLKKALHHKVEAPEGHVALRLAEAYSASGQFEEALRYYEEGLKEKLDPHALFGYGFTAYQLGEYGIAIEQLSALKALDPDFTSLYPYLAKAYEAEHRLDEAMETLKEGMAVDEYNETLYIHAGKLSFKLHENEQGEVLLRKVIALNPSNLSAIQSLAAYFKHEEKYEELLDLIGHTKAYGEEDPLLTWYEAAAYREQDEYDKACELYERVSDTFASDADFLEEYGRFLLEYGERQKALEKFTTIVENDGTRLDIKELIHDLQLNGEDF